jgi:hypothetical protein
MPLEYTEPKFVVKNISGADLTILSVITMDPLEEVDLFALTDIVSKTTILNELRPPLGRLYIDINVRRVLQVVDLQFFQLSSLGFSAKGQLITYDGYIQYNINSGPDGYALLSDSSEVTGLRWGQVAAVGGGGGTGTPSGADKAIQFNEDGAFGGDGYNLFWDYDSQILGIDGYIQISEFGSAGTPPSGFGNIYSKTDGYLYFKNDAGAEFDLVRGTPRQEIVTTQNITGTDTALSDKLNFAPVSSASVLLFLNGVFQAQGAGYDYTISGITITWLASSGTAVDLTTSDVLVAVYQS